MIHRRFCSLLGCKNKVVASRAGRGPYNIWRILSLPVSDDNIFAMLIGRVNHVEEFRAEGVD